MKDSELSPLTLQAINELVAKKMGWKEAPKDNPYSYRWIAPVGLKHHGPYGLPDFSTDIKAAWEIVEWLVSDGFEVSVGHPDNQEIKFYDQKGWHCNISGPLGKIWSDGYGPTAPMAICLAFLKLP